MSVGTCKMFSILPAFVRYIKCIHDLFKITCLYTLGN